MLLKEEFDSLIKIISNTLDAYTTALFLCKSGKLKLISYHTLSRYLMTPLVLDLENGGILTLALEKKGPWVISNMDKEPYEIPYYRKGEEVKAFMTSSVNTGEALICVDSKRQYKFTEKSEKVLLGFAELVGMLLKRAQRLRDGELWFGKYRILREFLNRFFPIPRSREELQKAFSLALKEWGVDGGLVLLEEDEKYRAHLCYGNEVMKFMGEFFPFKETIWKDVLRKGRPLLVKQGNPRIFPEKMDFSSVAIIPFIQAKGAVGLASKEERFFDESILDLLEALALIMGSILEHSLEARSSEGVASFDEIVGEMQYFIDKMREKKGYLLVLVCNLRDLDRIDERYGFSKGDKVIDEVGNFLKSYLTNGEIYQVRGNMFVSFMPHSQSKNLEALGKVVEKWVSHFSLEGDIRPEIKLAWDVFGPQGRIDAERELDRLLKDTGSKNKGIFKRR